MTNVPDENFFSMRPSTDTRGSQCRQAHTPSRVRILLVCQKTLNEITTIIEGCSFQIQKNLGLGQGGHLSPSHDQTTRPLGIFIPTVPEVKVVNIPLEGYNFEYEASDVSGDIELEFSAQNQDGVSFPVEKSTIHVQIPDLIRLDDIENLTMQNTGHIEDDDTEGGSYGTADFHTRLDLAIQDYYQLCRSSGIRDDEIISITSEAASLNWGGLYDINFDWRPSHCGHRLGNAIDIAMSNFRQSTNPNAVTMRMILEQALRRRAFNFPIRNEGPSGVRHWHTQHD